MKAFLRACSSAPRSALVTLGCLAVIGWGMWHFLSWAVVTADFVGASRDACRSGGACWVFVYQNLATFLYGALYPQDQIWRLNALFTIAGGSVLFAWIWGTRGRLWWILWFAGLLPIAGYYLLCGGLGLAAISSDRLGGLTLTLVIAYVGIMASLPLGILLALGRRSEMPLVRWLAIGFIEFWRGVPLITVLFMASVMLPLFLPRGSDPDGFAKLMRCLIGVALFSAAYMAEVVRGGLQTIERGQYEAAYALGLRHSQALTYIILPQALIRVIPAIINNFIGLLKDTTLVMIVGMFDLLGAVQATLANSDWLGYSTEGYLFAGGVFWVLCFGLSRLSQHWEQRFGRSRI